MKRVGILALLQESNTFIGGKTELRHFEEDVLLFGDAVRDRFAGTEHEIGGFFSTLDAAGMEAVPIFAARAYPFGVIDAGAFEALVDQMLGALEAAGPLDGLLVAPHGATVAENHRDADGWWLSRVRQSAGLRVPIIGTLDPHANLSSAMVAATDALVAYRTNPHLDQRETGEFAGSLMVRTLNGEISPVQEAAFPPMAINIQSQQTDALPLSPLFQDAARYRDQPEILSDSVLLGFPYADVPEMGSATLAVTDGDAALAEGLANELATEMWTVRRSFEPRFVSVGEAIADCEASRDRITLLDMGDNVGGGSPGDGTILLEPLAHNGLGPAFVCLHDPESVEACEAAGLHATLNLLVGAKSDLLHGEEIPFSARVTGLHDGKFSEPLARHGGFGEFDMGRTAVVQAPHGLTLMLTSKRVPPFSLEQLRSCGLEPDAFRLFVAKGVIAPMAAYGEACDRFIHVNTPGCTCADMTHLKFRNRRRPMFPFEKDTEWDAYAETESTS